MKDDTVARYGRAMPSVIDTRLIGLTSVARIRERHVVPVCVFDAVETPAEDSSGIGWINDSGVGFLAEVKLLAGFVRGQEVGFAIGGREFLDFGEAAFDFGAVFIVADVHEFDVDAGETKDIVIA